MIFKAKVTMPPRGIEMKPHQVLLKTLMTVMMLLMMVKVLMGPAIRATAI